MDGGGGGFLSEAGLRERAQAQGRVFGAGGEGVRIWAFWLWDFGIITRPRCATGNTGRPVARRARRRTGACVRGEVGSTEKLAEWDDFGAHFWPPLDRITA